MHPWWFVALAACGRVGFDDRPVDSVGGPGADAAPDGLALYVDFEDGLVDSSGRAHAIGCEGACPSTAPGARGIAGSFDATSCVTVEDREDLRPPAFTIAVWVRLRQNAGGTVFGRPYMSQTGLENSFEIYLDAAVPQWIFLAGGATIPHPAQVGAWIHLAVSSNGTEMRAYADGVPLSSSAVSIRYAPEPVRIGCDRDFGVVLSQFQGDIDELRFYDRVLLPAEITALATR